MKRIFMQISLALMLLIAGIGVVGLLHYNYLGILFIITGVAILSLPLIQLIHSNKLLDQEKDELQNRFTTIFDFQAVGMALISLEGKLLKVNPSFCQILGFPENEILHVNFTRFLHSDDLMNYQYYLTQLLDNSIKTYQCEQRLVNQNGEIVWVITNLSLIRDQQNRPLYFISQIQNISAQKNAEEQLRHMAYHDPLTGLANRNKLEQYIHHLISMARRHQNAFALLFFDLDRFKNINDTIGHGAGDILLQIVAERLKSMVRSTDLVARLGGDEFVVVITDVKKTESLAAIAQKILDVILKVMVIKGNDIYITTSIGISLYPYDGQTMQTLMKNADLAMYRAKEQGRNNYQFYTLEMTTRAQEKMALQNAIGHALVKNEFILHYQPKMDLATSRITGIEALLRWQNKEYGMIAPDEIVSLAEETGLIIPVSEWVMTTAIKQLKQWQEMGFNTLTMAINCTGRQLRQANFVESLLHILNENGVPASLIELEITESLVMQDTENMLRVLYELKDLGIKIAVDDFGTGYWSLNNLRRFSVDKIKIDKSFISQIPMNDTCAGIVSAIIAMAKKLGVRVIAEGVETREQYEFLLREGCSEIQGYLLSHPVSSDMMTEFLKKPESISNQLTT